MQSPAATPAAPPLPNCRPPAATVPDARAASVRALYRSATSGNVLLINACSATPNVGSSSAGTRLVRITHPFHPLSGKELARVGERYNRNGRRFLLRVDDV